MTSDPMRRYQQDSPYDVGDEHYELTVSLTLGGDGQDSVTPRRVRLMLLQGILVTVSVFRYMCEMFSRRFGSGNIRAHGI